MKLKKINFYFFVIFSISFIIYSCEKEENETGNYFTVSFSEDTIASINTSVDLEFTSHINENDGMMIFSFGDINPILAPKYDWLFELYIPMSLYNGAGEYNLGQYPLDPWITFYQVDRLTENYIKFLAYNSYDIEVHNNNNNNIELFEDTTSYIKLKFENILLKSESNIVATASGEIQIIK